jgi:hypothetical protein
LILAGASFSLSWTLLLLSVLLVGFLYLLLSATGSFVKVTKYGQKRSWILSGYFSGMVAFSLLLSLIHADHWFVLGIWQWWMSLLLVGVTVLTYKLRRALNPPQPGGFIRFTKIGEGNSHL